MSLEYHKEPPKIPGRSFLSPSQRKFLLSDHSDRSSDSVRQTRKTIRDNYQSALIDLQVATIMSPKDQELCAKPMYAALGNDRNDDMPFTLPEDEVEIGRKMFGGVRGLLKWYIQSFDLPELEWIINRAIADLGELHDEELGQVRLVHIEPE